MTILNRRERIGACMWVLCLQFFGAEQLARRRWTLPYSFVRNYVSDLGALRCGARVCSPWHAVMNGSFALQGVLIAGGALLLWAGQSGLARVALGLLVACGLGVLVVGFVPEDANMRVHGLAAAVHFLGGGLGMVAAGLVAVRRKNRWGWTSVAAGIAVVVATVMVGKQTALGLVEVGAVERLAAYGIAGWMAVAGICLLRRRS